MIRSARGTVTACGHFLRAWKMHPVTAIVCESWHRNRSHKEGSCLFMHFTAKSSCDFSVKCVEVGSPALQWEMCRPQQILLSLPARFFLFWREGLTRMVQACCLSGSGMFVCNMINFQTSRSNLYLGFFLSFSDVCRSQPGLSSSAAVARSLQYGLT